MVQGGSKGSANKPTPKKAAPRKRNIRKLPPKQRAIHKDQQLKTKVINRGIEAHLLGKLKAQQVPLRVLK
jgi:hypothetical protein